MGFTGQLNDLALSELIEFFCNQRKTGRLKVDYALAPGVFFIKDGDLVDAKVGALNGTEAVFFALTLPSASFDFSAGMQSSRRTINDPWASVVLEGLRRLDEGILPDASDAFATEEEIDEATIEYLNCMESAKETPAQEASQVASPDASQASATSAAADSFPLPLSQTLEATGERGGKGKLIAAAVVAAVVIACAVAAVPLSKRFRSPATPAPAASQATTQGDSNSAAPATDSTAPAASESPAATDQAAGDAALAARRERMEREARLERARKLQEARKADAAAQGEGTDAVTTPSQPAAVKPSGAKAVRVAVTYDEAGRVTQASAVGSSPGAEAYASTAVRVARGRRFPAGKAGTTVITIPIN